VWRDKWASMTGKLVHFEESGELRVLDSPGEIQNARGLLALQATHAKQVATLQAELLEAEEGLHLTKATYEEVNRLLQQQTMGLEKELVAAKVEQEKSQTAQRALQAKLEFFTSYQVDGSDESSPTAAAMRGRAGSTVADQAALQAKLDKAVRQATKLSTVLAEIEAKYVERQIANVSLHDQVNTLEDEKVQLLKDVETLTKAQISVQEELSRLRRR
jgi:chromosome segregation ATPase